MYKDLYQYPPTVSKGDETSLLTAPVPPEIAAEMRRKEEMVERARILVMEVWLEAYKAGELTLEKLCRKSRQALIRVPEGHRQRALGQMLDLALMVDVPARSRGNKGEPYAIRKLARDLAAIAHDEYGLVIGRSGTAWERVAEILVDLGVGVTPRQIEEWCYEVPK